MSCLQDCNKQLAEYFVICGLPENPEPFDLSKVSAHTEEICVSDKPIDFTNFPDPIIDIEVVTAAEVAHLPTNFTVLKKSSTGKHHTGLKLQEKIECFICFSRGRSKSPIVEVGILNEDEINTRLGNHNHQREHHVIRTTPDGKSAAFRVKQNLPMPSQPYYLCYERAVLPFNENNELALIDLRLIYSRKDEICPPAFREIKRSLLPNLELHLCKRKGYAKQHIITYDPKVLYQYRIPPPPPSSPLLSTSPLTTSSGSTPTLASPAHSPPITSTCDFAATDFSLQLDPEIQEIAHFCLPWGASIESWSVYQTHPLPYSFSFVLTNESYQRLYGVALTFYEPYVKKLDLDKGYRLGVDPELVNRDPATAREQSEVDYEPGVWSQIVSRQGHFMKARIGDRIVGVTKTICLISRYSFPTAFTDFLIFLHSRRCTTSVSNETAELPLERYLAYFLTEVPFPDAKIPNIYVDITPSSPILLQLPDPIKGSANCIAYCDLLRHLGVDLTLQLLVLMLTEQKVLLTSLHPSILCRVGEALTGIIHPLRWTLVYIPYIYMACIHVVQSPSPFLIGVETRFFDYFLHPPGTSCIDLDTQNYVLNRLPPLKANSQLASSGHRRGRDSSSKASPLPPPSEPLSTNALPQGPLSKLKIELGRLFKEVCSLPIKDQRSNNAGGGNLTTTTLTGSSTSLRSTAAANGGPRSSISSLGSDGARSGDGDVAAVAVQLKCTSVGIQIREAFRHFMAALLKPYREFLIPVTQAIDDNYFNTEAFLKKATTDRTRRFYATLFATQHWANFVRDVSFASDRTEELADFEHTYMFNSSSSSYFRDSRPSPSTGQHRKEARHRLMWSGDKSGQQVPPNRLNKASNVYRRISQPLWPLPNELTARLSPPCSQSAPCFPDCLNSQLIDQLIDQLGYRPGPGGLPPPVPPPKTPKPQHQVLPLPPDRPSPIIRRSSAQVGSSIGLTGLPTEFGLPLANSVILRRTQQELADSERLDIKSDVTFAKHVVWSMYSLWFTLLPSYLASLYEFHGQTGGRMNKSFDHPRALDALNAELYDAIDLVLRLDGHGFYFLDQVALRVILVLAYQHRPLKLDLMQLHARFAWSESSRQIANTVFRTCNLEAESAAADERLLLKSLNQSPAPSRLDPHAQHLPPPAPPRPRPDVEVDHNLVATSPPITTVNHDPRSTDGSSQEAEVSVHHTTTNGEKDETDSDLLTTTAKATSSSDDHTHSRASSAPLASADDFDLGYSTLNRPPPPASHDQVMHSLSPSSSSTAAPPTKASNSLVYSSHCERAQSVDDHHLHQQASRETGSLHSSGSLVHSIASTPSSASLEVESSSTNAARKHQSLARPDSQSATASPLHTFMQSTISLWNRFRSPIAGETSTVNHRVAVNKRPVGDGRVWPKHSATIDSHDGLISSDVLYDGSPNHHNTRRGPPYDDYDDDNDGTDESQNSFGSDAFEEDYNHEGVYNRGVDELASLQNLCYAVAGPLFVGSPIQKVYPGSINSRFPSPRSECSPRRGHHAPSPPPNRPPHSRRQSVPRSGVVVFPPQSSKPDQLLRAKPFTNNNQTLTPDSLPPPARSMSSTQLASSSSSSREEDTTDPRPPMMSSSGGSGGPVIDRLHVTMSTCSQCPLCQTYLYDEDIAAGWRHELDESGFNTRCFNCEKPFVPQLTVRIHGYVAAAAATDEDSAANEFGDELSSSRLASRSSLSGRSSSRSSALKGLLETTHYYLSPFALRREVEQLLESSTSDADDCLRNLSTYKRTLWAKNERLAWNLVYAFNRLGLPSHLLDTLAGFLSQRQHEQRLSLLRGPGIVAESSPRYQRIYRSDSISNLTDALACVDISLDARVQVCLRWNAYHPARMTFNRPLYRQWRQLMQPGTDPTNPSDRMPTGMPQSLTSLVADPARLPTFCLVRYTMQLLLSFLLDHHDVEKAVCTLVRFRAIVQYQWPVTALTDYAGPPLASSSSSWNAAPNHQHNNAAGAGQHQQPRVFSPVAVNSYDAALQTSQNKCTAEHHCSWTQTGSLYRELLFFYLDILGHEKFHQIDFDSRFVEHFDSIRKRHQKLISLSDRAPSRAAQAYRAMLRPLSLIP